MKFMKNNIIASLHGHGTKYCTVFQESPCGECVEDIVYLHLIHSLPRALLCN